MDGSSTMTSQGKTTVDVAAAVEIFDYFCNASTIKSIIGYHRHLCNVLNMRPAQMSLFYPKLKAHIKSWKAQALWKKFDARAAHKCYNRAKVCSNTRVLIIGAGPCGLRTAIEAQLLGAKVVLVEKRDRFSRNNVLHLWPFVIQDLRALGAKKFFGKFCAGSIDHISIRQLQCILLKVALLLGVEVHTEVGFVKLLEPIVTEHEKVGWRAQFMPDSHPIAHYEFDVLIGADGRRNTLAGFTRKEFRGKLAIAITANFINRRTEAEARAEEISGVAFIFNQKFFKDLHESTGIDLENIVYYKDDTHYFVMTAKKQSLLEKHVIINDLVDTNQLLAPKNVNRKALMNYAREAAEFSTLNQMPNMEFAVNHYGEADVAMFDFTSMYAAENASRIVERRGFRLLMMLVGDSLLEPFWPTGSGCARGFLSALDACWAIRGWGSGYVPLDVIAERESIYRLLAQTTPENLNRDIASYTLDPVTRYPNLNKTVVVPEQVLSLYDTDDPANIVITNGISNSRNLSVSFENVRKRRRKSSHMSTEALLFWFRKQVSAYQNLKIEDLTTSFKNGLVFCAIIHKYRPDLIDYHSLRPENALFNIQLAFGIFDNDFGISPIVAGREIVQNDNLDPTILHNYLTQIYETFRGAIPYVDQPNLVEMPEVKRREKQMNLSPQRIKSIQTVSADNSKHHSTNYHYSRPNNKRSIDQSLSQNSSGEKRANKRKSYTKHNVPLGREPAKQFRYQSYGANDEGFGSRVRNFEEISTKSIGEIRSEKKPKDLIRSIGKIESNDWNVKEIEKKILENQKAPKSNKAPERVPKWTREQFEALQQKVAKHATNSQQKDSNGDKFATLDEYINELDLKLKEGSIRQQGSNKVFTITEKFTKVPEVIPIQKSGSKTFICPNQSASETCYFCKKRVYCMERMTAENKYFHMACFRCDYCNNILRLRAYTYDREGIYGHKFFCNHHFGMTGESKSSTKLTKKPEVKVTEIDSASKKPNQVPNLDNTVMNTIRVHTPERIEYSNFLADSPEKGKSPNQIDEDEWTDRNFGSSLIEMLQSDSDDEDDEDDDEDDEDEDDEEEDNDDLTDNSANSESGDVASSSMILKRKKRWSKGYKPLSSENDSYDDLSSDLSDSSSTYNDDGDNDDDESSCDNNSGDSNSDTELTVDDKRNENNNKNGQLQQQLQQQNGNKSNGKPQFKIPVVVLDKANDNKLPAKEIAKKDKTESSNSISVSVSVSASMPFNSETEISTDPEFDNEVAFYCRGIVPYHQEQRHSTSFANDKDHNKENQQTSDEVKRLSVRCSILEQPKTTTSSSFKNFSAATSKESDSNDMNGNRPQHVQFKPLINTSNESINKISKRFQEQQLPKSKTSSALPLINPNKGDYFLSRTQSSGGNMSNELKKKFFMTSNTFKSGLQKSGSVSIIDSKLKSFKSSISEKQKLLNPAAEISPSMKVFLETSCSSISPKIASSSNLTLNSIKTFPNNDSQPDLTKNITKSLTFSNDIPKIVSDNQIVTKNENEASNDKTTNSRRSSPVHDTILIVPNIKWDQLNSKKILESSQDIDTDSLSVSSQSSSASSATALSSKYSNRKQLEIPRVEIRNSKGDLMEDDILKDNNDPIGMVEYKKNCKKELNQPKKLSSNDDNDDDDDGVELNLSSSGSVTETESSSCCINDVIIKDLEIQREKNGHISNSNNSNGHVCGKKTDEMQQQTSDSLEFIDDKSEIVRVSEKVQPESNKYFFGSNLLSTKHQNTGYCIIENYNQTNEDDDGDGDDVTKVTNELRAEIENGIEPDSLMIIDEPISNASNAAGQQVEQVTVQAAKEPESKLEPEPAAAAATAIKVEIDPTTRKIQQIHEERTKNSSLIHEMVLDKILSGSGGSGKSKRNRTRNLSFTSPKSTITKNTNGCGVQMPIQASGNLSLRKSKTEIEVSQMITPGANELLNSTDIRSAINKLREDARARAKLKTDQELGLSPEEKFQMLRQRFRRTINFDEVFNEETDRELKSSPLSSTFKSDSNLLKIEQNESIDNSFNSTDNSPKKTPNRSIGVLAAGAVGEVGATTSRSKDRDRRKSLLKSLTEFFQKRKEISSPQQNFENSSSPLKKDKFSMFRLSPKIKEKSKSCFNLKDIFANSSLVSKSLSENIIANETNAQTSDELFVEHTTFEEERNKAKRITLEHELKIQLRETDTKINELEKEGAYLEEMIRCENIENNNHTNYFKQWFSVMRQLSDIKITKKELIVQLKEFELNEEHERLQIDLKSRQLKKNKTTDELLEETRILNGIFEVIKKKEVLRKSLCADQKQCN